MTHTEEIKYTKNDLMEYLKCKDDPVYFIKNYYTIHHPVRGAIRFDLYPFQEKVINRYKNNRHNVVLSSRQVGTSATSTAYILWYAIFHSDRAIFVCSDTNDATKELIQRIQYAYTNLPIWFKTLVPAETWNKHELTFDNGTYIRGQKMSPLVACGSAISLLYVDNMAFAERDEQYEFWNTVLPCIVTGGECILASGPNKDNDLFAKIWHDAKAGENSFTPTHIAWYEPPGRDPEFKENLIELLGPIRWHQQYECQFLVGE